MPTYKRKTVEEVLFYHVCTSCNERISNNLTKSGWKKIRDGDPVSCIECSRECALTTKGLWAADDNVRYTECTACDGYETCPLKGRYYC